MSSAAVLTICELFDAACIELFSNLDCDVFKRPETDLVIANAPIAYIDAGNEDLEVLLVLHIPLSVLTMTYPEFAAESIMSVSEEVLEDWVSELANQLIGRFKNKLISYGCTMKIGLPAMFYDENDAVLPIAGHQPFRCFFDIDKEPAECSLYLQILNEQITLTPPADSDTGTGEGEMELF